MERFRDERELQERFLGCLLGMAIGDALGMPVEGWATERIREQYGWIDRYLPRLGPDGQVETPAGERLTKRLTAAAYLQLVAATNFKQRVRKMMEYYHADRLHYVVAGTPNRLEYDQGFFVKQGDGAADIKPIAHLYKTQVYQLAEHLGVPDEIRRRPPTTDTFSLAQTQEEFYFAVPYDVMDLCLYGLNHGVPAAEVAAATNLTAEQVERVYRDIEQKRRTTRYLHAAPALVEPIPEVGEPCAE